MYIDKDHWWGNAFKHHAETYGPHKSFGYKDFIPDLTAANFDAAEWATLFKESGAKYVVPVAEHHDGFPMYDCSFTEWKSTAIGPKRDILRELQDAVKGEGLYFGASSHRAFNWIYFVRNKDFDNADPKWEGLYGRPIPELFEQDAANYQEHWPPQDQQFKDDWLARTCELVDNYDLDLIWFDFGIANDKERTHDENPFQDHLKQFAAYYYNQASKKGRVPVLNYKWKAFSEESAVLDLERNKMSEIRYPFWQTDTAVAKNSWGYIDGLKYKQPNRLVDDLVDIVAKNGCLLLNISPKPDGTIPAGDQEILREIGAWLKINGEAIYGSRPFKTFGEGPTGTNTGHLAEDKDKPYTAEDIRFTTKDGNLYVIALEKPDNGTVLVKSLKAGNELGVQVGDTVSMLGTDTPVKCAQDESGLKIELPEALPCQHAFVVRIPLGS
jgi:alpha-L-fucosidase